jgi:hypothetical protein
MASPYRKQIFDQILDGKRTWSVGEDFAGDYDDFKTQAVDPLRELKYAGVIEALSEIDFAIESDVKIAGIEIIGPINYHPHE